MTSDAVIFDLFGTLVPPFSMSRHSALLLRMSDALDVPADSFEKTWGAAYERRGTGEETVAQQIRDISRLLGRESVPESTVRSVMDLRVQFFRETVVPRSGAINVLKRLRSAGLKLGLVSNCSSEAPLVWPTTPFAPLIDVAVFSCEAGCHKPDPRMYRAAWEPLGVQASKCLYVGDGGSEELTGAQQAGMRAVLLSIRDEQDPDAYVLDRREQWAGPTISSLEDVVSLAIDVA